jgi:hypothetical protein
MSFLKLTGLNSETIEDTRLLKFFCELQRNARPLFVPVYVAKFFKMTFVSRYNVLLIYYMLCTQIPFLYIGS